jgi:hypothetical protein
VLKYSADHIQLVTFQNASRKSAQTDRSAPGLRDHMQYCCIVIFLGCAVHRQGLGRASVVVDGGFNDFNVDKQPCSISNGIISWKS